MSEAKTIAFFPEAAYGPALNSVGIAQACEALGHEPVFLTDPAMASRLATTAAGMHGEHGPSKAARLRDGLLDAQA